MMKNKTSFLKKITETIFYFFYIAGGWCIIFPLAMLIPKKKGLTVFIGRDNGKFVDNVKYMYLYLREINALGTIEYYFITSNQERVALLRRYNLPVLYYPSPAAFIKLLRANITFIDNNRWSSQAKYFFLVRSKLIQLWHGAPIKQLAINNPSKMLIKALAKYKFIKQPRWLAVPLKRTYLKISGQLPAYHLFCSNSANYTNKIYRAAFNARDFLSLGFPRNDVFFRDLTELDLIDTDMEAMAKIKKAKSRGQKVILYAPTHRIAEDTHLSKDPLADPGGLDFNRIDLFCKNFNYAFVVKFHAFSLMKFNYLGGGNENTGVAEFQKKEWQHIIVYEADKDLNPCLKFIDLLISDYSSVHLDFLLLNRPILFFPYDYDDFMQKDYGLAFDYDWITPGKKCHTQDELQSAINSHLIEQQDEYARRRKEILDYAFDRQDGHSARRIWDYVMFHYI